MTRRSKTAELMEVITELRVEIAKLKTQVDAKAEPAQPNPPVEPKPAIYDQPARAVDGTILNVCVAHPVGSIVPFPKPKKPESQKAIERQQRADARMYGPKRRYCRIGG